MTKKIKLAYIVARFPSVSQTFIMREIIGLQQQGVDIDIFPLKLKPDKITHQDAKDIMNKVYYIPPISLKVIESQFYFLLKAPLKYLYLFYLVFRHNFKNPYALFITVGLVPKIVHIARIIEKNEVNHIHAHMATFQASCAMLVSVLTGIPFSFTGHATDIRGDQAYRTHNRTTMIYEKMRRAKFILTCTYDNITFLQKTYKDISPDKFILNYHGIDTKKFTPKRCEDPIPLILAVGRLLSCKGFEYLLDACSALEANKLQFKCLVVGDGPDKDALKKKAENLNLKDMVVFTGSKTQEELIELYNRTSLFVLPSISESHFGIPNTLFEAMSMNVPVIVSNLPAVKELISSPDLGIVIEEKKVDVLYSAIYSLLTDINLRNTLGKNGRKKVVEYFDIKDKVKELKEIFQTQL